MYSFKNIYSENINGYSAGCFITGPTKCGKSWYLRYNMRKFQNSQISPLVFYFDMSAQKLLSFETFLHLFEKMMIDTLVAKNNEFCKEQNKGSGQFALTSQKQLFKVIFRFYDRNVFE